MTIVKSVAIGAATKSLGELTYKRRRGRTIASQRITENKSNTTDQQNQRKGFAITGKTAKALRPIIDLGFPKSKHGSSANNFMSSNKEYINFLRNSQHYTMEYPSIMTLYMALIDEDFYGNVLSAKGSYATSVEFDWDEKREINGYIDLSRTYQAGDKITIATAYSYKRRGSYYETVRMCEKELGSSDIKELENPNEFIVNTTTIPELEGLIKLPEGATELNVIITGIITGKAGNSTSSFIPAPTRPFLLESPSQEKFENTILQVNLKDMEDFSGYYDDDIDGALLYLGGLDSENGPFTACGFVRNQEGKYSGIKFKTPDNKVMTEPLSGDKENDVQLIFNNQLIALLNGVINPMFAV